jgi:hypothetical protein
VGSGSCSSIEQLQEACVLPGVPSKVIAACAGLCGFSIALIAGIAVDNPAEVVLVRALGAMFACQIVGWVAGTVAERIVRDAVSAYREAHPVNTSSTPARAASVDNVQSR